MVLDVTHIFMEHGLSHTFHPFLKLVNEDKAITFDKCKSMVEEMIVKAKVVGSTIKGYISMNDHSKSQGKS